VRFLLVATCDFLARIAKPEGETTFIEAVSCCCSHYQFVSLSSCQPEPVHFPYAGSNRVSFWWGLSAFQCLLASPSETDGTANSRFGGRAFNLVQLFGRLGKILAVHHWIFPQLT